MGLMVIIQGAWSWNDSLRCKIMQFTGLKDKNGKEIYEGDIICNNYNQKAKVIWSKRFMAFLFINIKDEGKAMDDFIAGIEVIGNIYENKEMIK